MAAEIRDCLPKPRSYLTSDPTTGAILDDNFYFIANTGIYNLENDKPVHIAVVPLK